MRRRLLPAVLSAVIGTLSLDAQQSPVSVAEPALVHGVPRSFQVVEVVVPGDQPTAAATDFEIRPMDGFAIVGPRKGTVRAGTRSLLTTIAIPAGARAGRIRAAAVTFSRDGATLAARAIDVQVSRVRAAELRMASARLGALAGDRLVVGHTVANLGNATDTIEIRLAAPHGWRATAPSDPVVLEAGAAAEGTNVLSLPLEASGGVATLHLLAVVGGDTIARAMVPVDVADSRGLGMTAGPGVTLGTSAVRYPDGSTGTTHSLLVDGNVTDDVRMTGRATMADTRAAGPLGTSYTRQAPSLAVSTESWRVQLGLAGMTLSDLAGTGVGGRGVGLDLERERWSVAAIAARPERFGSGEAGEIAALRVGGRIGDATVGTTASHLVDARLGTRRLDALAGDIELPLPLGGAISGELAGRRYGDGETAIGVRAELRRRGPRTSLRLRVAHAPGGTSAFARAADDYSAQLSQSVGRRVVLSANAWGSQDRGASWQRFTSEGWSLSPSLRVTNGLTLGHGANRSSVAARGSAGAMSSDETSVAGTLHFGHGAYYASGGASTGTMSRDDQVVSGERFTTSASKGQLRGTAGVAGWLGRVELEAAGERSGQGIGQPVRQAAYRARLTDVRLVPGRRTILARATLERLDWFGDRPPMHQLALGLDAMLPFGFRMSAGAERNPFMSSLSGGSRWIFGLRVERLLELPRFRTAAEEGVLYRDLNASGARDRGEPGVAGIVVRRHSDIAVTDRSGRYRFGGDHPARIEVDARTLPSGLVLPPSNSADSSRTREIGLVAVAIVPIRLVLDSLSTRVGPAELSKVVIFARDASGQLWTARAVRAGLALFEALPPGRYTVGLDASASTEPLRVVGELPVLDVTDGGGMPEVTIRLQARRIRMREIASPSVPAP